MHPPTQPESGERGPAAALTLDPRGIATLAAEMQQHAKRQTQRRTLAAIAGLPGSGKSTLARALCIHLNRSEPGSAALVALDGFHLPDEVIAARNLLDRKGAPPTFDAMGYFKLLAKAVERGTALQAPAYDRKLHEPVYTGNPEHAITRETRYLLSEGNYLLLDELPWTAIDDLAAMRWYLDTPAEQAEAWLIRRHIATGRSIEEAQRRVANNDRLNAELVTQHSRHADRVLVWPRTMLDEA
ncbi:MAG: nucleoside/nucleotide kinase family protein [Phycisphaerales bacterium JB063]